MVKEENEPLRDGLDEPAQLSSLVGNHAKGSVDVIAEIAAAADTTLVGLLVVSVMFLVGAGQWNSPLRVVPRSNGDNVSKLSMLRSSPMPLPTLEILPGGAAAAGAAAAAAAAVTHETLDSSIVRLLVGGGGGGDGVLEEVVVVARQGVRGTVVAKVADCN
jgi:hypothetical protein